jgi:hypothetical protein
MTFDEVACFVVSTAPATHFGWALNASLDVTDAPLSFDIGGQIGVVCGRPLGEVSGQSRTLGDGLQSAEGVSKPISICKSEASGINRSSNDRINPRFLETSGPNQMQDGEVFRFRMRHRSFRAGAAKIGRSCYLKRAC